MEFRVVLGAVSSDYSLNQLDPDVQILPVKYLYYIYQAYDPKNNYQSDIAILHLEPGMAFQRLCDVRLLPTGQCARSGRLRIFDPVRIGNGDKPSTTADSDRFFELNLSDLNS